MTETPLEFATITELARQIRAGGLSPVKLTETCLERIGTLGPEPTELIQPVINLLEWLWLQTIETALCVHGGFDETGVAQHAQVL